MASNEATNAADPAAETNAVPKNQGMTDWGEPLTVTIPPPFADVVRNILGNKLVSKHMKRATSKQKWKNHRQSKRQSKKHNKFKNKQKTLKAAKVKPIQLKLSEKSAADAEIAALQKSTEEIEEQERKSPVDDMANMMEVLPDFLKERVLVALDTGEKPPHWVIKLMRKMGVDFDVLREVVLEKAEKDQTQVLEDIKSEEEEAEEESESGSESESEDEEGKRRVRGGVGRGRGGFRGRGRGGRGRGRGVNGNCAKGQGKGKFVGRGRGRGRRGGGRGGKFSNRDKKPEDFFGNMLKDGMEMLMEKMQQFGIDAEFEAKFTEKHLEKKEEEEEGQEPKQELSKEDKKALRRSKRESKRKERKEKKEKKEKKEEVKQVNQEKTNPNPEGLSQEELVKLFSQLKRDKKNKSDSQ